MKEKLIETIDWLKSRCSIQPKVGVILGSGLGEVAYSLYNSNAESFIFPYSSIPHFGKSTTVKGHKGNLIIGNLDSIGIAILQGRYHLYEGHNLETVIYPVAVLISLGIKNIIITNAAGALNQSYQIGDLVLIKDQINFIAFSNAQYSLEFVQLVSEPIEPVEPIEPKDNEKLANEFKDYLEEAFTIRQIYSPDLIELTLEEAKNLSIPLHQGIYAGLLGPSYETPAEIKMLAKIGIDLVGMSTVFESSYAASKNIKVLGISTVTNYAAGISSSPLSHEEVLKSSSLAIKKLNVLLPNVIRAINNRFSL